ncbi:unnamed protein product [Caenorhabditis auriculariae]|uniref:Uncharacterized protein n=1 Tax=Caenorhabditis auriculariae TaxID=2777116 RepID=A0A8S1GTZ7_9PELO|nr:unnamed protein product [Caenorhabditis auriculariae]
MRQRPYAHLQLIFLEQEETMHKRNKSSKIAREGVEISEKRQNDNKRHHRQDGAKIVWLAIAASQPKTRFEML